MPRASSSRQPSRQALLPFPHISPPKLHQHTAPIPIPITDRGACPPAPRRRRDPRPPLVPLGDVIEISDDDDDDTAAPPPVRPSATQELRRQIRKLKEENEAWRVGLVKAREELEEARALVAELKAVPRPGKEKLVLDASRLEDDLNCEICTHRMWSPHILPGCGHTFCQACLQEWFSTTLAQFLHTHPLYRADAPPPPGPQLQLQYLLAQNPYALRTPHGAALLAQAQHAAPQYTCPTCRAPVRAPPVEDFALKSLVRTVAAAMDESSPKRLPPPPPPLARGRHGVMPVRPGGPWDGFFPRGREM